MGVGDSYYSVHESEIIKQKPIIVNKCQRNPVYNAHIFLSLLKAFTQILITSAQIIKSI